MAMEIVLFGFERSSGMVCIAHFYLARSWASAKYWKYFMVRFDDVNVFGYNSAESDPIWMKSRAL